MARRAASETTAERNAMSIVVKAKWNTGDAVTVEMDNLDPDTLVSLLPWLRERRMKPLEEGQQDT